METFWEHSWETISSQRILEYVDAHDLEPDDLIQQLHLRNAKTVCDAGCGCGIYSLKLTANGFLVSGFDVSARAVEIASDLVRQAGYQAELRQGSVLSTPYPGESFDGVICRDVLDHMGKSDSAAAIRELLRITAPGGLVVISVDHTDEEYETETHFVSDDGDYVFTRGKWEGMVFHPYTREELLQLVPENTACYVEDGPYGLVLWMEKKPLTSAEICVQ